MVRNLPPLLFLSALFALALGAGLFVPGAADAKCPCDPAYVLEEYWFLDDESGDQNAVSGWSSPDTAASTGISAVARNTIFRLRLEMYDNKSGNDQDTNFQSQIEYSSDATSCTSGTWTKVTTASADVQLSDSGNFTEPVATTERLTADPGWTPAYVAGEIVDQTNPTADKGTMSSEESEDEWALIFTDAASADPATYRFRLTDAGTTTFFTYPADCPIATAASTASTLTFSISDNSIGFGTLSDTAARFANGAGTGSATDVVAHTITASTNGAGGYVITVNGSTLTSGANTITAMATEATSSTGTEQFGLYMTAAGGNGTVDAVYDNSPANSFALVTAAFPDQVASDPDGDDVSTTYSVHYLANIAAVTEAGSYTATLTYIATGNF